MNYVFLLPSPWLGILERVPTSYSPHLLLANTSYSAKHTKSRLPPLSLPLSSFQNWKEKVYAFLFIFEFWIKVGKPYAQGLLGRCRVPNRLNGSMVRYAPCCSMPSHANIAKRATKRETRKGKEREGKGQPPKCCKRCWRAMEAVEGHWGLEKGPRPPASQNKGSMVLPT